MNGPAPRGLSTPPQPPAGPPGLALMWQDGDDGAAAAATTDAWLAARWPLAGSPPRVARAAPEGFDPLAVLGGDADPDPDAETASAPPAPQRLVLLALSSLRCDEASPRGIPYRPHLLNVAERNGWKLAAHEDVAEPALRWLRWADAQRGVPGVQPLQPCLQGLRQGDLVAEALCFERLDRPAQSLVRVGSDRSEAMRELFAQVFGHEMGAAQWHWKYGDGRGCAIGIVQDGRLVAHYGGQRRELLVRGRPDIGCQMCDVMVAPAANRSLARRGPMHKLSATFLETQLGWGQAHRVGFGFPSDRHNGLADRLRLYTMVDRLVQLRWPAANGADAALPPHRSEPITLRGGRLLPAQRRALDALWQAMAFALRDVALGVRNPDWLRWRYLESPHARYGLTLLRSRLWRRPLGLIVTRPRDDALELLDLVGPPGHWPLLVALARWQAAQAGKPSLRLWITQSQSARLASIDAAAVLQEHVPIQIPANLHTPGPDPQELKDRWFLMGGDADFA